MNETHRPSKREIREKARKCMQILKSTEFEKFGINPYGLEYIQRSKQNLEYLFDIYTDAILLLNKKIPVNGDEYIVDFGGGCGFLSFFLNYLGYKVIYCDQDPLCVQTVKNIKDKLELGPEHFVKGNSLDLLGYCTTQKLDPPYLVATDLIEHVYDLNYLFANLHEINPDFTMVFTTFSNPRNPFIVKNLRHVMKEVEKKFYLPMRMDFLSKKYPNLPNDEKLRIALNTRGLKYEDIEDYTEHYLEGKGNIPVLQRDKYNTCDPQSGNWMERILSTDEYASLLKKNGFKVIFKSGYYRSGKSHFKKLFNKLIKYSGNLGFSFAPYLILIVSPRNKK